MSPTLVALCYGSAIVVSLYLLWHFGPKRWYWHALSLSAALIVGFWPGNEFLSRPDITLITGWFFVAFFVWGMAAPAFAHHHSVDLHPRHR